MKTIPKRYPKIVVGTFVLALVILIMSFIAYDKSTTEANNTVLEITSVSIIDGNYKIDTNIAINNGIKEKLYSLDAKKWNNINRHNNFFIKVFIVSYVGFIYDIYTISNFLLNFKILLKYLFSSNSDILINYLYS